MLVQLGILLLFGIVFVLVALRPRWLRVVLGALLLGPFSYAVVGFALAGKVDPQQTRFYYFPFGVSYVFESMLVWMCFWGVILYFAIRPKQPSPPDADGDAPPDFR